MLVCLLRILQRWSLCPCLHRTMSLSTSMLIFCTHAAQPKRTLNIKVLRPRHTTREHPRKNPRHPAAGWPHATNQSINQSTVTCKINWQMSTASQPRLHRKTGKRSDPHSFPKGTRRAISKRFWQQPADTMPIAGQQSSTFSPQHISGTAM